MNIPHIKLTVCIYNLHDNSYIKHPKKIDILFSYIQSNHRQMTSLPIDIVNYICEFVHDETQLWRPVFSPNTGLVSCWKVNPLCKKYIELSKQLIKQRYTSDVFMDVTPREEWGFPITYIVFERNGKRKIYIEAYVEGNGSPTGDNTFRAMLTVGCTKYTMLYYTTDKYSIITKSSFKWNQETNSYTDFYLCIDLYDYIEAVIEDLADIRKQHLNNIGDLYKPQLIKGYTICKGINYNFKSIEEEEQYFTRSDITPEEEVYYYEYLIRWAKRTNVYVYRIMW